MKIVTNYVTCAIVIRYSKALGKPIKNFPNRSVKINKNVDLDSKKFSWCRNPQFYSFHAFSWIFLKMANHTKNRLYDYVPGVPNSIPREGFPLNFANKFGILSIFWILSTRNTFDINDFLL